MLASQITPYHYMNMTPEASEQIDQPQPLHFIEQPDIVPVRDKPPLYILRDNFPLLWRERLIVVPAGFMSDGATIPRWLWSFAGYTPDGLVRAAALVHDWLYAHGGVIPENFPMLQFTREEPFHQIFTRKECDELFLEVCIACGVPVRRATAWYRCIRIFGASHWDAGLAPLGQTEDMIAHGGMWSPDFDVMADKCKRRVGPGFWDYNFSHVKMINATR